MAGICFWLVFFWEDQQIVMLSKGEREAQKLLAKSKLGYKYLPRWMVERGPRPVGANPTGSQFRMQFDNDSQLESLPSASDPARGESVSLVVVDEWASIPNPEEAWASIEPIADVGGRVIGLSTAKGSGNFFHDFWIRATTGSSGFTHLFYPWSANTDRDKEWYESKRRTLPGAKLYQEYPQTAEEAFLKSGNPVFDVDQLNQLETIEPIIGYLESDRGLSNNLIELGELNAGDKSPYFMRNEEGIFQCWKEPERGHKYVIGADIAEGLEHGDFSVAQVIDKNDGLLVAKIRTNELDPTEFAREVYRLGYYYNRAFVGIESNNHGLTTVSALNRWNYPFLYRRHVIDERRQRKTPKLGWLTTAKTKPFMIDELAVALRERPVIDADGNESFDEPDLRIFDDELIGELKTFVRDPNGKMGGSPFDDQVIAVAIANQMIKHSHLQQDVPTAGPKEWTGDWWDQQSNPEPMASWQVGANSVRRTA